ncbi:nuclease-related domain-containing protein [Bacillus sp. FJAT-29814]|uniref:nuclease-related domain-containing protein n=1 Tax=Bacillus sp. FJAT-29814 TaxID=1729688 RepID=UPI00156117B0|nr:nuclease-related domain-containing protein [Bacillus sp. FJAT-29814]
MNARMGLLGDEKWRLEKGFAGEVKFDSLTDELLHNKCWIINGLWLKSGDSAFQIDKVMIFQKKIYLTDVKNYEGDYHYDAEGRIKKGDTFIRDPLNQLQRAETLFRQILQQSGFNFIIESYLVYINPEFTLYNAPPNHSVILPTQVNKFLKKLNTEYSKLNEGHEKLAELLVSLDLGDSPYSTYPQYSYEGLRKGIINCFSCYGQSTYVKGNKLECRLCGAKESLDAAVLRGVQELKMLFPEMKITTNLVFEWCGGIFPKKMIRRILKTHFKAIGKGKYCYYEN